MFEMNGCSGETAAIVALDPTGGLIAKMGLSSVLCVVGVARDVSFGNDVHGIASSESRSEIWRS